MVWFVSAVLVALLLLAPLVGMLAQPWAPWWMAGATLEQPGVVPIAPPPQGPLPADDSALLRAIQPWLGVPYIFGGATQRGVDCSAFTQIVFRTLGISLPRTAQTQYDATTKVSQPEIGDLVFFERTYSSPDRITHVGIVVAAGMMISAAEPAVGRQSLTSAFWRTHFAGYGRPRR